MREEGDGISKKVRRKKILHRNDGERERERDGEQKSRNVSPAESALLPADNDLTLGSLHPSSFHPPTFSFSPSGKKKKNEEREGERETDNHYIWTSSEIAACH